jgi:hypothetical protein
MRHHRTCKTAIIPVLLMASMFSVSAVRADDGPGSAGAAYLLRPVGPKSIAMGEVKAALCDDPFNWLSNPATLPPMKKNGFGLFHSEWLLDTRYTSLSGNTRVSKWFTLGAGVIYEYGKDIQGYDALGQMTDPLKNYNYQALVGLGFGPAADFSAGVNLKYFRETLSEWSAGGYGFDIGVFYDMPFAGVNVGLTVQNVGPDIKFIDKEEPIPTTVRAGAVYTTAAAASNVGFSLGLDFVKPRFESPYLGAGLELAIVGTVAIRGGWCGRKDRAGDGFTFGTGIAVDDRIAVDYAATSYGDLGLQHIISLYFGIR